MSGGQGTDGEMGAALDPFRTGDPLITALGPVLWRASDTVVEMRVDPSATALNAGGALHGGSLSAWLDMAMYELARRKLGPCVTISLTMQFLDAGSRAPFDVVARFTRPGRAMAFCAAEVTQNSRQIAAGTAIYKATTRPGAGATQEARPTKEA